VLPLPQGPGQVRYPVYPREGGAPGGNDLQKVPGDGGLRLQADPRLNGEGLPEVRPPRPCLQRLQAPWPGGPAPDSPGVHPQPGSGHPGLRRGGQGRRLGLQVRCERAVEDQRRPGSHDGG